MREGREGGDEGGEGRKGDEGGEGRRTERGGRRWGGGR